MELFYKSVYETHWKDTFSLCLKLTWLTSTNIFFKDFASTLRKCKFKAKMFWKFQNGCFSERIAMLSFIWKERDSNGSREKGVLLIGVSEYNFSECFKLKIRGKALNLVKLQAKIWKPMTLQNSAKKLFVCISQNANVSGYNPPILF